MIFRKSLLRELLTVAAAAFLVLIGISLTTQIVRLLGQAASGYITSESVATLLGFSLVNYLPVLLSLTLTPWAVSMSEELRRQIEGRDDVAAIAPGMFRESRQADRVYFVEEVPGQQNIVANVFVSSSQLQKQGVMVAARGFTETAENGDRFLVLMNGRRYEGEP